MNGIIWFLAGWMACAFSVTFARTFRTYRTHRSSLESIKDEVSTINELVGEKLDSSEGQMFSSFEMVLPDDGYREVIGKGMNVYLSQNSAERLGEVYSMVGLLNQFFEKSEPADPQKLYEIVENLSKASDEAVELLNLEMEEGVYSSYLNFLRFHTPV